MKNIGLLIVVIALFSSSCKKEVIVNNQLPLNKAVELKKGSVLNNTAEGIRISLDSVVNDSRCALDVVCVWEGNAEAYFTCTYGDDTAMLILNSNPSFKNDTLVYGYLITLLDLKPYPLSDVIIDPESYTAEISIQKP